MTTLPDTTGLALEFAASLPGLSPRTSFRLDRIEGAEGLYALRSATDDVRLFLIDPAVSVPGYSPRLTAAMRAQIGAGAEEVRVFVVANPSGDGVSLNLRAPVLVNARTGAASQVIFDDTVYPIRAMLGSGTG